MREIRRDYIVRELRDMVLLSSMLAAAIGAAIPTAHISPFFLLLLPLFLVWFLVRMYRRAAAALEKVKVRPEEWKVQVEREYREPHQVRRVAYGEAHLLESCMVCRHKRQLLLIPFDELLSVREDHRLVWVLSIPVLYLSLAGGRNCKLDFSARHPEDGRLVYAWLVTRAENNHMDGEYQ